MCLAWAFPEQGVISVCSVTLKKCLIQAFTLFPIEAVQEMLSTVCSDKRPLHYCEEILFVCSESDFYQFHFISLVLLLEKTTNCQFLGVLLMALNHHLSFRLEASNFLRYYSNGSRSIFLVILWIFSSISFVRFVLGEA